MTLSICSIHSRSKTTSSSNSSRWEPFAMRIAECLCVTAFGGWTLIRRTLKRSSDRAFSISPVASESLPSATMTSTGSAVYLALARSTTSVADDRTV